jgi:hypothetical protein
MSEVSQPPFLFGTSIFQYNKYIFYNSTVRAVRLSAFFHPVFPPTRAPPGQDISTALSLNTGIEAALVKNINIDGGRDSSLLITNPADQVGELWIRGPNITLGYWRNERATKEAFGLTLRGLKGSDWLRTGDRVSSLSSVPRSSAVVRRASRPYRDRGDHPDALQIIHE